jgi:hypothetical protein
VPLASSPLPSYLAHQNSAVDTPAVHDTCFHLLKLRGSLSHSLEDTLSPAASVANPFDHRLSFLLATALQVCF